MSKEIDRLIQLSRDYSATTREVTDLEAELNLRQLRTDVQIGLEIAGKKERLSQITAETDKLLEIIVDESE